MTSAESSPDRHARRRPFSHWMKRLTNLKSSSSDSNPNNASNKRNGASTLTKNRKNNNPYLSGPIDRSSGEHTNGHLSFSEPANSIRPSHLSQYDDPSPTTGDKSAAPTLSTTGETTVSDAGYSKAGTCATGGNGFNPAGGGEGSTFSSPSPSVRSLTTTLTTIQSAAPSTQLNAAQNANHYSAGIGNEHHGGSHHATTQHPGVQFTHQFPTSPITAVPPHLVVNPNPTTYSSATANNLLTDNASVLTLASSSKRRRRNSLDTNASVLALAPSSLFSGSRESLPLSMLSGHVGGGGVVGADQSSSSTHNVAGVLNRGGASNNERASVHSMSGIIATDRGSVRSGIHSHHGRNDSITGSIGMQVGSAIPGASGRVSRRGSGWGEIVDSEDTGDETQREESDKDANGKER
ncbi:hypothetical protein TMEN_3929 [Trichophyton mentagrophytes]|uniref:Ca2+-modulated nonselective cation channel polycystin n=1 Tax=Trichophyton interdigitale (strain MR816) TaxID=1215338 RepID=A0A059JI49_TRIIM|nr:hypothetical protein H101_06956 [Trichophyton interdigitale H6]KAF3891726.1 hypothetical protein GY631_4668 [Trichophyton interdigitale]KDB27343.1 hypothetical protein H109_00872 [Trichophyton interdigitale MR816]GBF61440.1 hypothetical protein TMEN_3929 [Trichophyton mentagrophytes]KAG5217458.1 hypothetical protein GY632_6540 [Trichophyton interdigitale]